MIHGEMMGWNGNHLLGQPHSIAIQLRSSQIMPTSLIPRYFNGILNTAPDSIDSSVD